MQQGSVSWTLDRDDALQFARRRDAELFAAEDKDAWLIQNLSAPRAAPEGQRKSVATLCVERTANGQLQNWWLDGEWRENLPAGEYPLYAAPPAAPENCCPGIQHAGCNYLAACGTVCNKCGQVATPLSQPAAPEGYVLVPVEPTAEMLEAGVFRRAIQDRSNDKNTGEIWTDMLAAAKGGKDE